jgi:hypothetical protein
MRARLLIVLALGLAGCELPSDFDGFHVGDHMDSGSGDAGNTSVDAGGTDGSPMDAGTADTSMSSDAGATDAQDAGCAPGRLFPATTDAGPNTIYCPFTTSSGTGMPCAHDSQHCCVGPPGGALSTCESTSTACPTADIADIQCLEASVDCTVGQVCCGNGTVQANDAGCTGYVTGFTRTHCASTCVAGEFQVCEANAECTGSARTCSPVRAHGVGFGGCI